MRRVPRVYSLPTGLLGCGSRLFSSSILRRASAPAPWESTLPHPTDARWAALGTAVVQQALDIDTGAEAFAEVLEARRQLEIIVQSCGYDLDVYAFGGFAVMGLLEVGGDVDFTAVADVEPQFEEASEIIGRLSREMRRLGIRSTALPKARVPVIKVDRASSALPGSPLHSNSSCGVFQFCRPLLSEEQRAFGEVIASEYHATGCEWDGLGRTATVRFPDTSSLLVGLTHIRRFGSIDIPVRVPLDSRQGPELYRFPFDFCLSSTGLHNSHLLGEYLQMYPYARHIALALKQWGRSSGVVNSMEGLLASYALTVMLVHFLAKMEVVPLVETNRVTAEPHQLPKDIAYRPLASVEEGDMAQVGYLFASFFEYYGSIFNYSESVVCTTDTSLTKAPLGWSVDPNAPERPPFYHFAIKDPFGHENIARNLGREAAQYVQQANAMVTDYINKDLEDPKFLVSSITTHGPRPLCDPVNGTYNPKYLNPANSETTEAFRKLKKMEFHRRRDSLQRFGQNTMRQNSQVKVAQDVTRNMLSWLKSDQKQ